MLVFGEGDIQASIGPVRSARFFLIQWASEVGSAIAHYGGDRRSRNYIVAHHGAVHERRRPVVAWPARPTTGSRRRPAPHNALHATTKKLRALAIKLRRAAAARRPYPPAPVHATPHRSRPARPARRSASRTTRA